jgi:uncharacterized protein (DUF58 family)
MAIDESGQRLTMRPFQGLRSLLDKWLFRLGDAEPGEVVLNQRRVFIVPSKAGFGFAILLTILFIGSVNYNLSLGLGLTFLIAGCALIDMHLTFRNLAYLYLSPGRSTPVFAGEDAQFELHLTNRRRHDRFAIWIGFMENKIDHDRYQAIDIAAESTCNVMLAAPTKRRGWMEAPRIRLSTRFPLGLLHAWSYWRPELGTLVYPKPEQSGPPLPMTGNERSDGAGVGGTNDFSGVRAYRPGDSIKHLAWRQIAKIDIDAGGNLVTKHFEGGASSDLVLDFSQLPKAIDVEIRLSRMTRWILEAEARALPYAFRLGGEEHASGCGPIQRQVCLRALALYEGN